MFSLYMQQITVEGIGLSGDEVAASLSRADVPWGNSSMEGVPIGEVFFLRDKIKPSGSHHHTLHVMTFIVGSTQASLIGPLVGVKPISLVYLITNVAHMVHFLFKSFEGVLPMVLYS